MTGSTRRRSRSTTGSTTSSRLRTRRSSRRRARRRNSVRRCWMAVPGRTTCLRSTAARATRSTRRGWTRTARRSHERLLAEPSAGHLLDERIPGGALVVVAEDDTPHQRRVRVLEPVVALERLAEPHHALFAADAADLDRLLHHSHDPRLASALPAPPWPRVRPVRRPACPPRSWPGRGPGRGRSARPALPTAPARTRCASRRDGSALPQA